jgi:hypothetical protein
VVSGWPSMKTLIASEQDRRDVARRRAQWLRYGHRIDPSRLVFIDETWTKDQPDSAQGLGAGVQALTRRCTQTAPALSDRTRP